MSLTYPQTLYTAAQGATYLYLGHREFYYPVTTPPTKPSQIYIDWVYYIALQTDNTNFTTEPNYGTFTNN